MKARTPGLSARPGRRQFKQRPIIGTGERGVEPGANGRELELAAIDAREDRGPQQDLAAGVGLTRAPGGEGFLARLEAGLARLELLEFGLEARDPLIEFGHGRWLFLDGVG